jgi:hypothetical protein
MNAGTVLVGEAGDLARKVAGSEPEKPSGNGGTPERNGGD